MKYFNFRSKIQLGHPVCRNIGIVCAGSSHLGHTRVSVGMVTQRGIDSFQQTDVKPVNKALIPRSRILGVKQGSKS